VDDVQSHYEARLVDNLVRDDDDHYYLNGVRPRLVDMAGAFDRSGLVGDATASVGDNDDETRRRSGLSLVENTTAAAAAAAVANDADDDRHKSDRGASRSRRDGAVGRKSDAAVSSGCDDEAIEMQRIRVNGCRRDSEASAARLTRVALQNHTRETSMMCRPHP
jgi:hypothetical protein